MSIINYNQLQGLTLQTALQTIQNAPRKRWGSLTIQDMVLNGNPGSIPFYDLDNVAWYGRGIYVFFNNGSPIYIGKAKKHFLHRFQSHLGYDPRPNWGWMKLLRKTAETFIPGYNGNYDHNSHNSASQTALNYEILRVNTFGHLPDNRISRLESAVMRGFFTTMEPSNLLNDSLTTLPIHHLQIALNDLMR